MTEKNMSGSAGDRDQPPDCILEDLERPGVLPPSPSPLTRSSQLVSQCITRTASCDGSHEYQTRLPGTFDSLQLVQNTGATPSPRPDTPLVLLPLQTESARESLQESLKRRLKSSLGVRLGGSNYGEGQTVIEISINKDEARAGEEEKEDERVENEAEDDGGVKDDDGDSFTTAASSLSSVNVCKICHCGEEDGEPKLITPCLCSGSLKFVHQDCLHRWIKSSDIKKCELCKFTFLMQSKVKPLSEWEKLDMSSLERRKLCCSITFHLVAITCVIWSLYVLIERTTHEIEEGDLQWPFWTKLIVVAIGFTGGLVFMYIQCKVYIQICRKWRAYNRTIVVQDLPQDIIQKQKKAIQEARKPGKEDSVWISSDSEGELNETSSLEGTTPRSDSSQSSASSSTDQANAETQTSIRGITLQSALWQTSRAASTTSNTSDISVATISRLLEQMEGGGEGAGLVTVPAVIFFTEPDNNNRSKRTVPNSLTPHRAALAEPLLICSHSDHSHEQHQQPPQ